MSRGDRASAAGNLSRSMRENYEKHGVSEYYKKVGSTYRNPHFPGIAVVYFTGLTGGTRWKDPTLTRKIRLLYLTWLAVCRTTAVSIPLDLTLSWASGECTLAVKEWWGSGKINDPSQESGRQLESISGIPLRKTQATSPIDPNFTQLCTIATDPYTSAAYQARTSLPCSTLSFTDVAEGALPPLPFQLTAGVEDGISPRVTVEMVICSFALHLIESPSQLFSLLWELSSKVRWLVILAPHKKPEIKDGWGWCKWKADSWETGQMSDNVRDLVHDRVHLRVYRSTSV